MSIRFLWLFLEFAPRRDKGELIEQLRARFHLAPKLYRDPDTRVPLQPAIDLLDEAIGQTGLRNVGVLAAKRVTPEHMGVVEYLARSKRTLGEALNSIAHYVPLLSDGVYLHVDKPGDVAIVRLWFDSDLVLPNAIHEFTVATLLLTMRRISGNSELAPLELHFVGPPPLDIRSYLRVFRCKLCFNMPVTQVVLHAQLLDLPLPKAEPALSKLLGRYAKHAMDSLPGMLTAETELLEMSATQLAQRLSVN